MSNVVSGMLLENKSCPDKSRGSYELKQKRADARE